MQVPHNQARLRAVEFYFKLVMNLTQGSGTQETASASDDDYWEVWYMQEHGGRRPTASELENFKEAMDDADLEETQARLFSSEKHLVSFNPKDFV